MAMMEFSKDGKVRASSLEFVLCLNQGRCEGQLNGVSEDLIREWMYCAIAWEATDNARGVTWTEQEEANLQIFLLDHIEEVSEILVICEEKLRTYRSAGGNPKSMDLSEVARQALACLEDKGDLFDTGERVFSERTGELVPVYKLVNLMN